MIHQEELRALTESYLKSVMCEVAGSLNPDFDSLTAFGELGIDSFHVLKIVRRLEVDFGTLPKSLLFENFRISDLAGYFVGSHEATLLTKFASELNGDAPANGNGRAEAVHAIEPVEARAENDAGADVSGTAPIRILERDAWLHPELATLVRPLFERYKFEGSASRGTRTIAPNLFIGSERRGYLNYGRSGNIILVYCYTGPEEHLATLREEMYRYCEANGLQLNFLNDSVIAPICGKSFSATPFGAMQRIEKLAEFRLDGGAMRRLRYQVSKFQKAGACRTIEYRCGTNAETDQDVARIIDRWCEGKTMVNPLVQQVRSEVLAGTLPSEHRLFLTYLDDTLQNVILITAMSSEINGYLMDLEFYPADMPLGGLEFAIVEMISVLAAEGCDVLSLGGTYGCKLVDSPTADPELDRFLDDLRTRNIFNDESNLQFKNKFRPLTVPIFLCRPVGSGDPENVIDIIMMIADPEKMQTPDADQPAVVTTSSKPATIVPVAPARIVPLGPPLITEERASGRPAPPVAQGRGELHLVAGNERERALAESGFNPLNVPQQYIDFDLKTDSWAQLTMPAIGAQMEHLHGQLQQPVSVDDSLRSIFPMTHFVLTESGQAAEHLFFKAWPKKGPVPQNLLFPSTIAHQIDKGFTPAELPHPSVFRLDSDEPHKAEIDLDALRAFVAREPGAVACAIIEVGNNAAGGQAVSTQHLRDVKAVLDPHSIPLVIDATRVLENARFVIERDREHEGKSLWTVVREILSCADAVIGSLTKDFCVNRGGIIATNDARLYQRLQELLHEDGGGLDMIERKLIALSLQNRKHIESKVSRRIDDVRLISAALRSRGIPTVHPAGGHCVLIDVKQLPEFSRLQEPVASFLAWLYLNTGIRAAAHSVGMQKQTSLNDLVRLAVPVGLKREDVSRIVERLTAAFATKANIPELALEGSTRSLGSVASYRVARYHNAPEQVAAGSGAAARVRSQDAPVALPAPAMAVSPSREPAADSSREISSTSVEKVPVETHSDGNGAAKPMPRAAQEVAVVGMAGRYPKARNVRELWANLVQGRDCIEEIPAERRERRLQHGSAAKYRGGFIDEVDRFDSLFFNISPREAEMLDPQERLFLEVAWEAIEDAGYYPEILAQDDASRNIGVFVGAVWAMYQIVGVDEQHVGNRVAPNSFLWSIANRVSYWMNLSGPSLTVDTACSSSLTALYLACEAIQSGECPAAIVGGVNLDLHQAKLDINLIGGALSPDGVCRTFGKGANGYVAGEGVGALLLKPLAQAEKDGDHIYGVIRSVVVNHGGRTSGYFVPNPSAQSSVISAALQKANVEAATIGYVEAHGTGTELGDPIEISGLSRAFAADVGTQTCAIGSIKTNIGHLEAAAGVASVSKVLLQMQHRQLVPSLHSSELNEHIDFERSPFYVVQNLESWKAKEAGSVQLPLRAGISSFGAGGANAHVILESYEPGEPEGEEPASATGLIFPLSARNEEQLRETALRLANFLRQNPVALKDASYTLQQGRKSFEHRVAIVAGTREELVDKLLAFVDGKKAEDVAAGNVKLGESVTRLLNRREKQELVRLLSQGRDPHRIAALWAEGMLADWQGFPWRGRRVSLPTYPFAGKRHWVGDPSAVRAALQPATAAMHPMVDTNESTFERQVFRKVFTERDFFIYDHLVSDIPTLPGVAYLEFARKAGELAAGRPVRRIQNILWLSPIAVQGSVPKEVFIELKPNGEAVQFEVFSETDGRKIPHSQGRLLYTNRQDGEPESIDLDAIRARCATAVDGKSAYPLFQSFGLGLGPSFQVLQQVYKNDSEALGVLELPEFRENDLQSIVLHPSLVDGSLQAGMTARLSDSVGEMMVPYSIGEVEILHPLQSNCFSYTTEAKDDKKTRVLKSNVLILDETGRVLVRIRESTGVPLLDVHKKESVDPEGFSRLYYGYEWEKAPLSSDDASRHHPRAILLFDTDDTLRQLYRVRAASSRVLLVRPGTGFLQLDEQSWEIDPASREDFAQLFEAVAETNVEDICFAWPAADAERNLTSFLFLCQSLTQAKMEGKVQLLYVDRDALPQSEAIGGFVNTLRGEYPKLICKAVQVRQDDVLGAIWAEQCARTQDANAVRHQADGRYVRRMKVIELEDGGDFAGLRENGVYLITGGAGGLGLIFAELLAKQYKARLVLTGRSSLSTEREAKLDELRASGAEVLYLAGDVSRREDVAKLIEETRARFGEINGIIHSAGVVRDSYVRGKTTDELRAVLAPKVDGTLHLDEVTKDDRLDFFVTFSSLAAVTGNPGQSDYSFANAFMDSFVAERERFRVTGARSGKSLSLNWSLWADGGMKPDEQTELALKKTLGMRPLSIETGLDAFVRGLASNRSQFAVLEGIQAKLDLAWGEKKKTAPPVVVPATAHAAVEDGGLLAWLQDQLSQIVMEFLKLEKSDVATDKVLLDLGFDSIGLASFANAINDKFQLDITPILFFDYPSIDEIAKNLSEERRDDLVRFYRGTDATAPAAGPAAPQPEPREVATFAIRKGWSPAPSETIDRPISAASAGDFVPALRFINHPIAIVGMSGVMPQSEDLEAFWENLSSSKDLVTVIPPDRWRWEDYYGDPLKDPNKSNSKWGGFMKEIDKFDPFFFGISPREAQMMDPQQRLFLEHVWKAVEDSGQRVSDLAGSRTGVFVGVATNDYLSVLTAGGAVLDGYSASGNSHSVLANRVSFLLGLRGPSAPLDTACSSSLVAMHRAIESIHTGSCDMAIVGGVHVMLSPAAYISFSSAGMLSPDGKCKTFDKLANGYVRGEGCGAVFLKSLAAAEADGNHIYAIVKATAENHGGRVTALTAPNSAAQAELLIEAYEKGQVDPSTIGYIEAHGTGTSLGDPIEIQALSKAFSELYKKSGKVPADKPHCGLSSVKTNIGHLETAAGIAGVLKAILAIKNQQIPANLHLEEVNPYIKLEGTPFFIADKLTPWAAPVGANGAPAPRVAGVSSFGFGGANAHVVLQEYIAPSRTALVAKEPQPVVLSAKNEQRLDAYMESMLAHLAKMPVELIDLAYTLQVGRDEMPSRVALVVSSTEELRQKLGQLLAGEMPQGCYRGRAAKDAAKAPDGLADPFRLAELWVSGAKTDWRALYPSGVPRRVSAPTYPFARERHWFAGSEATVGDSRQEIASTAVLHPLVHRNSSTFEEQKFSTRFSGEEFFLADHVVETQKILPGVAYLEMARAAGTLSANADVRVIRNLIWEKPLIVGSDAKEVEVSLSPARGEIRFAIRSAVGEGAITHCTGRLGYEVDRPAPEWLDIAGIRERCREQVMSRQELYPFLSGVGLKLGSGFQIVQSIYANESESLAILELPEHLRKSADLFWLHPALMDGSLHTAIGLLKAKGIDAPLGLPYSVDEVQILHPLRDLHYGYATWSFDPEADVDRQKVTFHLLDKDGRVLVRLRDFTTRPLPGAAKVSLSKAVAPREELKSLLPIWNPVRLDGVMNVPLAGDVLLVGGDRAQWDWVRSSCPAAQLLDLAPADGIDHIAEALGARSFEQLLWIAPDVMSPGEDERIIDQQEEGVLAVFRIIKALLQLGYGNRKLQWTVITGRTQRVTEFEQIQPAHAGIIGLVGSLAKEYPHWDLRLLDLGSPQSVTVRECLSLPWDEQGNALAHRHGEWFRQELALVTAPPETSPVYRQNGVYVIVGGAGGVGEVWSRFMIENYQARVVWIGRQDYNAAIEAKVNALSQLGPAPLYISADATDVTALARARESVLEMHSAIHGVVHSAIVLRDQSLSRMEESTFRASLAAKVDISVNLDRVFGNDELDFLLFFSSIISLVKSPGQSNYAAGCTFKDSFAHRLQQQRPYPAKIMNWGYWGDVGVVADESHKKIMRQIGIGSIEPHEGMSSLQVLVGSGLHQLAIMKTIGGQSIIGLDPTEAVAFYPQTTPAVLPQVHPALAG